MKIRSADFRVQQGDKVDLDKRPTALETILSRSERAWRSFAASALPAPQTISLPSERAWRNCAASALRRVQFVEERGSRNGPRVPIAGPQRSGFLNRTFLAKAPM